jgi:hypothetical protein
VTATIKESLSALNLYIDDLEHIAAQAQDNAQKNVERATQKAAKKSPPDLFSVPSGAGKADNVDTKALASRLDGAIAKVEKLLKEGA